MSHSFLFIDIEDRRATLVRLPTNEREIEEGMEIEGRVYEDVECLQDFISHVLDMTYSDSDGLLMASEMQGRDWSLEPIENEWYVTLRRVPEVQGLFPRHAEFETRDADLLARIESAIRVKQSGRPT